MATRKTPPAASDSPKRVVPKASPLKGTTVEEFIKTKLTGWQAKAAHTLVKLVAAAAPDSAAVVKWGQPVFELNGPFAYIRSAKAHMTFGFWRGAELDDQKGLLEGDGDRMKHVKLASVDEIDERALTAFVKQAVSLNREKGSPTRK
jgi:hypothetical protein